MAKITKKAFKVGRKNYSMKPMPKDLFKIIVNYQDKLERNINKQKQKKVTISFVYAAKHLAQELKKKDEFR